MMQNWSKFTFLVSLQKVTSKDPSKPLVDYLVEVCTVLDLRDNGYLLDFLDTFFFFSPELHHVYNTNPVIKLGSSVLFWARVHHFGFILRLLSTQLIDSSGFCVFNSPHHTWLSHSAHIRYSYSIMLRVLIELLLLCYFVPPYIYSTRI